MCAGGGKPTPGFSNSPTPMKKEKLGWISSPPLKKPQGYDLLSGLNKVARYPGKTTIGEKRGFPGCEFHGFPQKKSTDREPKFTLEEAQKGLFEFKNYPPTPQKNLKYKFLLIGIFGFF